MSFVLRAYQVEAVESVSLKKNGIIVLPTGSGKSLCIAAIAKAHDGKVIVLQPSKEILLQNKRKMQAFGETDIGVYSASCNRKDIGKITFATIGSVFKKKDLFTEFSLVIVDECHLVNSKGGMYEDFINGLDLPTIGLTATPYRLRHYNDNFNTARHIAESRVITRTRPRIFSKINHITQVEDLFASGYLCPLEYTTDADYRADDIQGNSTGQGYDERALLSYNQMKELPGRIAEEIRKAHGREVKHVLAFTMFRSETEKVLTQLRAAHINCAEVAGETPKKERESILAAFQAGDIFCVVNVGTMTVGFDFPELDCVVLGRPTRSVALAYQMIGRGVRRAPGKERCHIVDLCDNVRRFGHIETFRLEDPSRGNGLWRLHSDAGYQTDRDVITGEDLEPENTPDPVVPIGKHRGTHLSDIPDEYIGWAAENMTRTPKWRRRFKLELARREQLQVRA